ncbi:transmembrane protein 179B [Phyllopteryx taeniolatus]|uniref:transmembrane protein 179B n=1 Tax=Phyllopteryx taeniolatus TaxID=161469 RepID=UPI002AD208AD|nr:transmembrane protein 179B [Phyllopteryx taeniolatus]
MMMRMRIMAFTWLLVLELVLYASCFVCGIVTAASLTVVQGNFDGRCPLYGVVSYNSTANVLGVQASSSASLCYFVSAVSVTVAVVCFSLSLYWLHAICIDGVVRRERVWMNGAVIVCGVFLFFLLISGCMLKIGQDALCDSVTRGVPNVTSCEEAQTKKWVGPIKGENFYSGLRKAETAAWVNFFLWLFIGVLFIIQRRQTSGAKVLAGSTDGAAGETEPFFNCPARPQ